MNSQSNAQSESIEKLSAEIHKCYCRAYERRFGKPYWTNGDYSKLDEPTKDYDREMAKWVQADRERICEPLVKAVEESDRIGSNESTVPAWQRLDKAVYETLQRAGIE